MFKIYNRGADRVPTAQPESAEGRPGGNPLGEPTVRKVDDAMPRAHGGRKTASSPRRWPTDVLFNDNSLRDELFGTEQDRKNKTVLIEKNQLPESLRNGKQEDVDIPVASDRRSLKGRFYRPAADLKPGDGVGKENYDPIKRVFSERTVVLVLSDTGERAGEQAARSAACYVKYGARALTCDYCGFGGSRGIPSEAALKRDAEAMWDHLTKEKRIAPENIDIHGSGLGASLAAHVARRAGDKRPPAALVLDRPIASTSQALLASGSVLKKPIAHAAKMKLGAFSVAGNLDTKKPLHVPIFVTTDKGKFGAQGEDLRTELKKSKFEVLGQRVEAKHSDPYIVMSAHVSAIGKKIVARQSR
jgi:hypothetical protein